MNKMNLTLALLLSGSSSIHASWYEFFKALTDMLEKTDQKAELVQPAHSSQQKDLDYYLRQFRADLAGLEQADIDAIVALARTSILSMGSSSITKEYLDQALRSALVEQAYQSAYTKAKRLGASEQFALRFAQSTQGNVIARLEKAQNVNGLAYVQFFGKELEYSIKKELNTKPTHAQQFSSYSYTNTTASSSSHSVSNVSTYQFPLAEHMNMLHKKLKEIQLTDAEVNTLLQKVRTELSHHVVTDKNAIPLTKKALQGWFEQVVQDHGNALQFEVVDLYKLRQACEQVRRLLNSKEGLDFDSAVFAVAKLRKFTPQEVTETILDNVDKIRCSICMEYFIEEMKTKGTVHRVTLSCPSKHTICAHDATWSVQSGTCPECKAPINKTNLQQQINAAHAPSAPHMGY
jgi:hypothetical protein